MSTTTKVLGRVQPKLQGAWAARLAGNPYKRLDIVQHAGDSWQLAAVSATGVAPAAPVWVNLTNMSLVKEVLQAQVDGFIGGANKRMGRFRLTHNQTLIPNEAGTAPKGWAMGFSSGELVETVTSGVLPESRSPLAREFLKALGSDRQHFGFNFNIWRITFESAGANHYGMYQGTKNPNDYTVGAIVKHETGSVPTDFWCNGLKAGEAAKYCGYQAQGNNNYVIIHPYIGEGNSGSVLVALPGIINGRVDPTEWGVFPSIVESNNDEETGRRVWD